MKKIYYILSLALATGFMASCSNDLNGTDELLPNDQTELPEFNDTRAFPEDDGAKTLPGQPAEKLYNILQGADSIFSARIVSYSNMPSFQFNEVKTFTDELVKDATTDARVYRLIYNWVRTNVKYAQGYVSNEPYDVFVNKTAVCQGYANLLHLMLYTQGVPVINANGYLNSNGFFGHTWNYVYFSKQWWLSDPTNSLEYKAAELAKYQETFIPVSADGSFLENDQYAYNYAYEKINLNTVKVADDAFVVPFSVTLNNGEKFQISSFNPTADLPSNVKEIYLGKNIISLGQDGIYGLRDHAPNVEKAYVDPANQTLLSYEGLVYEAYSNAPVYVPNAMKVVYLKPTSNGIIEKNVLCKHPNVEELYIPEGTTELEAWAVENCPNLKVAYLPLNTECNETEAFVGVHPDFKIVRMDMTGIKDVIAD